MKRVNNVIKLSLVLKTHIPSNTLTAIDPFQDLKLEKATCEEVEHTRLRKWLSVLSFEQEEVLTPETFKLVYCKVFKVLFLRLLVVTE